MSTRKSTPSRSRRLSAGFPPKSPSSSSRKSANSGIPTVIGGDDSSVTTSNSGTSVGIRGLPPHVLKQVLTDIEHPKFGGIGTLKQKQKGGGQHLLANLLNESETGRVETGLDPLYEQQGSSIRIKIGEYSQRWKKLSNERYLKLLKKVGVTPCEFHPEHAAYFGEPKVDPVKTAKKQPRKSKRPAVTKLGEQDFSDLSEEERPIPKLTGKVFTQYPDKKEFSSDEEEAPPPPPPIT